MNFRFYRVHSNWHKHPLVSKIMCWMGRHDYEYLYRLRRNTVRLECAYCEQRKDSTTWIPEGQI